MPFDRQFCGRYFYIFMILLRLHLWFFRLTSKLKWTNAVISILSFFSRSCRSRRYRYNSFFDNFFQPLQYLLKRGTPIRLLHLVRLSRGEACTWCQQSFIKFLYNLCVFGGRGGTSPASFALRGISPSTLASWQYFNNLKRTHSLIWWLMRDELP